MSYLQPWRNSRPDTGGYITAANSVHQSNNEWKCLAEMQQKCGEDPTKVSQQNKLLLSLLDSNLSCFIYTNKSSMQDKDSL